MKTILKYITILFCCINLGGCSKTYLDKPPLTQINNDIYWKTSNDLENYVLQFYNAFPAFNTVGSYLGLIGWDGTRGSDTQISSSPSTVWDGTRAPVTAGGEWKWENIRDINVFFANYQKCEEPFEKYQHFLGEAHFFKAWFYFEKVRDYGDVPWFSTPLEMDSEELYKTQDSRTVVVDSILWHLDKAIEYMKPLSQVSGGNNRLSKEAALIFKSRVALYEGTWQKYHKGSDFATPGAKVDEYLLQTVRAGEELMKSEYNLSLYSNSQPNNDYCNLFSLVNQEGNKEVILWKSYAVNQNLSHSFQIYVSDRTAGISMTLQQVAHYLGKDGRPFDYFDLAKSAKGNDYLSTLEREVDPRFAQTIWTPGQVMWDNGFGKGIFSKPFLDKSGETLNNTGFQIRKGNDPKDPQAGGGSSWSASSETGVVLFRYAEALLNYAEAKAELGQSVDYDRSINLLRRRVGMPDFKVQNDPNRTKYADYGYSLSDELYEIRRERSVELAAEGYRYDDLRRWAAHKLLQNKRPQGYPLKDSEWEGQKINYKVDEYGFLDPFVGVLPKGYGFNKNRDYLNCVPINEITLNPALNQNPGW